MLKYFNKYGQEIRSEDFIEVQWNRKYNECGNFEIYLATNDYNVDVKYVQLVGRPETGIIQKITYEKKPEGEFVSLSGFFLEKLAEWGAQWCDYGYSIGNPTAHTEAETREALLTILYSTFTQFANKEELPPEILSEIYPPIANNIYCTTLNNTSKMPSFNGIRINAGISTGEAFYDICNADNSSYFCKPIFNTAENEATQPLLGLDFNFYKGEDVSESIFFGTAWNNVKKIDYTFDDSINKAHYMAVQQVEDITGFTGGILISTPDGVKGYIRENIYNNNNIPMSLGKVYPVKVLKTDISGIDMISVNQNEIREQMKQQATLDMLNNYKIENISVDVIQNRFKYIDDYNLGDVCSVVIDEIEQMYKARIVEIYEVYSKNKLDIQLVLGTPQKQKYRKVII